MSDNLGQNIIELAKQLRRGIESRDAKALNQVINAYTDIYRRLQPRIDALSLEVAGMEAPTASKIRQLQRYKQLVKEIERELRQFQGYLGTTMTQASKEAIKQGITDAATLSIAQNPAIRASWNTLNPAAMEQLIGFLTPNGALMKRLEKYAGTNALKIASSILENVALGKGPREIARLIRDDLGSGLTDALRMTRTVQIYSYREANRASYIANSDVVEGWYWMSALDPNSCMACVAMHGTFHTNDETLDDHYNGLCTMLPAVIGNPPPIETGEEWFNSLTEEQQRAQMGDARYEAWQNGSFEFKDMTTHNDDDVYGTMIGVAPLTDLVKDSE